LQRRSIEKYTFVVDNIPLNKVGMGIMMINITALSGLLLQKAQLTSG
jgi:hypothetical protein